MAQTISLPKVNVTKLPDSRAILSDPQRILVVGQKVASGSATSGALVENIANGGAEDALFGANSRIAGTVRAVKSVNQETQVDAISLDDNGAGVAATGTIAFSGTNATEAGTYVVNIGSRKNHSYSIAVAVNDTPTVIGDALEAAILADTDVPVTAVNTTGSVALTADNKGTMGNNIGLEVQGTIAGITVAVTAMSSGATDPVLTNLFDVVGEQRYQTIVFPSEYGFDFVTDDFLDNRFNVDNNILSGQAFCGKTDTLANLKSSANSENSPSLVIIGNEKVTDTYYKGSAMFELDDIIAGKIAGVKALRLTEGATISDYVATNAGSLDRVGGIRLNSFPYFNTQFANLPLIDTGKGFTQTEIDELKDTGISVLGNNRANTSVLSGEIVTTYKTDAQSNPDITWKFLNYVNTGEAIAEYFFDNLKTDYSQSRLTDGDLSANVAVANEAKIRASMVQYYKELSELQLTRSGEANFAFFKDNLDITLDLANGKVTINAKVPVVVQLRILDVNFNVTFDI
jgi:phage tail sheath gpL-like